jgi:D-alanyl-D-alanine carboxypeptidase (penicillin-binding protein 5/6)
MVMEICGKAKYSCKIVNGKSFTWKNSNKLIDSSSDYYYAFVNGMKTGTTDEAGCCLVASARINGRHYIAATFGSSTTAHRFSDGLEILLAARDKLS